MDHFHYRNGELYAEDRPLREIAEQYGTPCYVYFLQGMRDLH